MVTNAMTLRHKNEDKKEGKNGGKEMAEEERKRKGRKRKRRRRKLTGKNRSLNIGCISIRS